MESKVHLHELPSLSPIRGIVLGLLSSFQKLSCFFQGQFLRALIHSTAKEKKRNDQSTDCTKHDNSRKYRSRQTSHHRMIDLLFDTPTLNHDSHKMSTPPSSTQKRAHSPQVDSSSPHYRIPLFNFRKHP